MKNSFDISPDGVLLAYHGEIAPYVLPAHYVLPELHIPEGVKYFANDRIFENYGFSRIYLPKSFLGYQQGSGYGAGCFEFDPQTDNEPKHLSFKLDATSQTGRAVHCYLNTFPVRWNPSFEVHPENPIYKAKGNHLYTKNGNTLLAVPYRHERVCKLESHYCICIAPGVFRDCCDLKYIFLNGRHLDTIRDDDRPIFVGELPKSLCIWGFGIFKIETFEDSSRIESESAMHNVSLFTPEINFDSLHDFYKIRVTAATIQHAQNPKRASGKIKKIIDYGFSHANEVLAFANRHRYVKVRNFLKAYKTDYEIKKTTPTNAVLMLENRIVFGTNQEVEQVLQRNTHIVFKPRPLALAARYGGLDKVKTLLDHNFCFRTEFRFCPDVKHWGYYIYDNDGYYEANFATLLVLDCLRPNIVGNCPNLALENGEVKGAKVLTEKERLAIIKHLHKRRCFRKEDLELCFLIASITGSELITKYLGGKVSCCAMNVFYREHCAPFKGELSDMLLNDYIQNYGTLIKKAKEMCGMNIYMTPSAFRYKRLYQYPESLRDTVKYADMNTQTFAYLVEDVIFRKNAKAMDALLDTGRMKTMQQVNRFIKLSIESETHEITAMLMSFKNELQKTKRAKKEAPVEQLSHTNVALPDDEAPVSKKRTTKRSSSLKL